ncbi:hypothetical protein [Streptomyces sp. NPDC012510]|uniref:hypothetical protein n=1 Tax=Streptomyces sp. NPDC012510 TaxID=3364838 RepID=UPI0036EC3F0B
MIAGPCEQVDGLTERFARRTASLHRALEKIALALAGRPAARPGMRGRWARLTASAARPLQ